MSKRKWKPQCPICFNKDQDKIEVHSGKDYGRLYADFEKIYKCLNCQISFTPPDSELEPIPEPPEHLKY